MIQCKDCDGQCNLACAIRVEEQCYGQQRYGQPVCDLPTHSEARKRAPIARGVLDYFPLAIFAIAELSLIGNEQHNPGEPLHWVREKSSDHADCIARHLIERGLIDTDGVRHSAKLAWRALALLELELEAADLA